MNTDLKYEKANIELRRSKVLELLAKGHSQTDIAKSLNVSPALISIDVQYIREQSKKRLETHFQDQLPYEYARALTGINATLKRVSEMLEENKDPKIKIECMKLQMDLWKSVMSMATDGGIIQRAIAEIKRLESQQTPSKDISTKSEVVKNTASEHEDDAGITEEAAEGEPPKEE
jgi:transposase